MATANYVLLEKITVGAAGASSVTFNSIPQTGYTDLVVKVSSRSTETAYDEVLLIAFNGSSSNFSWKLLNGSGSGRNSYSGTNNIMAGRNVGTTATANTFSNNEVYIPNYTSSNYKSFSVDAVVDTNSTTANDLDLHAGLWSNTAAITSITITPQNGSTLLQYSTFYLYGVAKLGTTPAIQPYATGGDTIMTDGTYWYHAFKSSGTFTPTKGLSCDVLVVAGGGGGGSSSAQFYAASGGGAGGVYYSTANSVTTTGYTVTIGAGGAGQTASGYITAAAKGNNSQFGALTAAVGGGSGSSDSASITYSSGGSAGGTVQSNASATATSGQGNIGGVGGQAGGGGGGAGSAGSAATNAYTAGNGGAGTNTYSTWLNTTGTGVSGYIAGGGGGGAVYYYGTPVAGTGGSGGGATGGQGYGYTAVSNAIANTGGGGGGAGSTNGSGTMPGSNGGSGLVIVRYAV